MVLPSRFFQPISSLSICIRSKKVSNLKRRHSYCYLYLTFSNSFSNTSSIFSTPRLPLSGMAAPLKFYRDKSEPTLYRSRLNVKSPSERAKTISLRTISLMLFIQFPCTTTDCPINLNFVLTNLKILNYLRAPATIVSIHSGLEITSES